MQCPNCNSRLERKTYHNLTVDECPKCDGMWLDFKELDELEDQEWRDDDLKGTTVYNDFASNRNCPKCSKQMKGFYYRMHDELKLEYCPNKHGFWLDKDEGEAVLNLIKQEEKDYKRSETAEGDWIKHLWRLQTNSSFIDKLLSYLPTVKGKEDDEN